MAGFGVPPKPDFWVAEGAPNKPHVHVAFRASSRALVDAFYKAALAAGRPVVSTRVGGVPNVVQDGVSGLLVPPQDPLAFAEGVLTMLADPARAARLGLAGRAAARAVRRSVSGCTFVRRKQ